MRRRIAVPVVALALTAIIAAPAAATEIVEIGDWGERPSLEEGRFEIEVLSTRASTVTGGDVLIGVNGLTDADDVAITLATSGGDTRDVTEAFSFGEDGRFTGLVAGLTDGDNDIEVTATHPEHGTRAATLTVTNHPITGPVFSGPHQEPFHCRTTDMDLGEPIDDDCSIETQVEWRYYSTATNGFRPLEDPYGDYPPDTATTTTTEGETVPYVVRIESSTINRGVTRIAVLDDPAARGPDAPFEPGAGWNDRVLYEFGQSCGTGFHQGINRIEWVLTADHWSRELIDEGTDSAVVTTPPVGDGYVVAHSTLTTLGVHCNEVLSAETFLMVREHIIETYGDPVHVMGTGASGGAIQQITTANGYPGILDGAVPMVSFPDVVTTAMSPTDCRLLLRVFEADPVTWTEDKIQAVTGFATSQICRDWDLLFADTIVASTGCDESIPEEEIYDPETNPDGIRCTIQDSAENVIGTDPATGFARQFLDNTGVQYGLLALEAGAISVEEFLTLNREVGGYDVDGQVVDERHDMSPELARRLYEHGRVSGRGALAEVPIIHVNAYIDLVPVLGFHDQVRAYQLRARLDEHAGGHDNQLIFNGGPVPQDAWPVMDEWLTELTAGRTGTTSAEPREDAVVDTRPDDATDRCTLPGGVGADVEECEELFRPLGSPRIAAGGPLTEDIIKCRRVPLERDAHPVEMTDEQWAELTDIFPDGVCDYDRPGVGEVDASRTWLSYGAEELKAEPTRIRDVVARSTAVAPAPDGSPPAGGGAEPGGGVAPTPATGGGAALVGVALVAAAAAARTRRRRG